jgi:flagellar biosynthesis/type III secretory pathway M-ring protein FliF/YscJ
VLVIPAALPLLVRSAEEEFNPDTVTPGIWGFVLTFLIMVVVVLLVLDMVRRIRRVNYRAEVREQLEAERAAQEVQALEGDFAAPDAPEPGTEPDEPSNGGPTAASGDDDDEPPAR